MNKVNIGIIIIGISLFTLQSQAQVKQKCIVLEMNSNFKPIANVVVLVYGAPPSESDVGGKLDLDFTHGLSGDQVVVDRISKEGYEVVNLETVKNWSISHKNIFQIILSKKGYIAKARQKYYKIGVTTTEKNYRKAINELNELKKADQLSEQYYLQQKDSLSRELSKRLQVVKYYADIFARINKDQLNIKEKKAIDLFEQGFVPEAIEVYETMNLVEQFDKQMKIIEISKHNMEQLSSSLINELNLLKSTNRDAISYPARIDTLSLLLIQSEGEQTIEYTLDYIIYLAQKKKVKKCIQLCLDLTEKKLSILELKQAVLILEEINKMDCMLSESALISRIIADIENKR